MEAVVRKPYEGVTNIIRFNWHFYVLAGLFVFALLAASIFLDTILSAISILIVSGVVITTAVSLGVSYYIYDRSGLYGFPWIKDLENQTPAHVVNINAGFDETSATLRRYFPEATLAVFDFYNPEKHTEVSIERARKAYAPYPTTIKIETSGIPLEKKSADFIFNVFALHEIRDREERVSFLKEQSSLLAKGGSCIIVEHLRDVPNFLAYNVGFFHFLSPHEWKNNFHAAGLRIARTFKLTPFVSVFILTPGDGDTR